MQRYWAYGLNIQSEIEFPELVPFSFDVPDVTVRLGSVPLQLEGEDVVNKVRVSVSPKEYLLDIQDVAKYYAADKSEIRVQPYEGADQESIRLFFLGNVMAAVLHQRNMIPMHASAVEYADGIVMFCGRSGAGKSTLVSALQQQGYKVFSDDVCVLKFSAGPGSEVLATPSYPVMKLWEDSFDKVGLGVPKEEFKLRPELAKYANYYHDSFTTGSKKVLKVFILNPDNPVDKIEIKKSGNIESFKLMQKNTYRHMQMNAMKKRNMHFSLISQLAATVPVYSVSRPAHLNTVNDMTGLISTYINEQW